MGVLSSQFWPRTHGRGDNLPFISARKLPSLE
jgi:hypothetical protein